MNPGDTIAAVATAPGTGGLSVVRVSGPGAVSVVDRVFRGHRGGVGVLARTPERRSVLGGIWEGERRIDEVLAVVFRGPRSFTGEDTVEVSGHGGARVTARVLETLLGAGARPAAPGEFTFRAYLNGRIDLSQAEAVADIVEARTDRALAAAQLQLQGSLSTRIAGLRSSLLEIVAQVEAHIDFPDEDISPDSGAVLQAHLEGILSRIDSLLATSREGRILREGLRVAIVGAPNAGKSSLLNRLLGMDRAIVSEVAGTTRDTIEERASVRGLPLVLVDTAGLRDAVDPVEAEGIRRSRAALAAADVVLHVVDASREDTDGTGRRLAEELDDVRVIRVANKSDLGIRTPPSDSVAVSCLTGAGLEELASRIEAKALGFPGDVGGNDGVAISVRHRVALERGSEALRRAGKGLEDDAGLELVAADLREALHRLEEVVGKTDVEEVFDLVFSRFCIGK